MELEPISFDFSVQPEERIQMHCIARARLNQQQATYRVGDYAFDRIARRLRLPIKHDADRPYMDYDFGTTVARIYAGGLLIDDGVIVVEDIQVIEPPEVAT